MIARRKCVRTVWRTIESRHQGRRMAIQLGAINAMGTC
jgi:hypothetical protein